jgi:hypothetical protein
MNDHTPTVQSIWDYLHREYQTAKTVTRQDSIVCALHILMAIHGRMEWIERKQR